MSKNAIIGYKIPVDKNVIYHPLDEEDYIELRNNKYVFIYCPNIVTMHNLGIQLLVYYKDIEDVISLIDKGD
ncbi:MAG: hypothetical protein RSE41_00555, partial [Clostridia bacterium]